MREHPFFTADYWVYAAVEYSAARTAAEVGYLVSVLPAGGRVLDLGCGIGRHAHGLAASGFDVVGVDVSEWAVARAAAGPGTFVAGDLMDAWPPLGTFDAVVCVQAFGWGSDADQVRLLRRVRSVLRPGGVLVLDHSNASAILRGYQASAVAEVDGYRFAFDRRYNPLSGHSWGEVTVERPDGSTCVLHDAVRLYHPTEVAALLERAGFVVSAVDADFVRGASVSVDTRYVQFVASPRVSALEGHRGAVTGVDLRWAPDEVEFVQPALHRAWAAVRPDVRRYDVADPHGSAAAPVLGRYFGVELGPDQVTAGAGATGLLRSLAAFALDGFTCAGHPEFALAAAELGAPAGDSVLVVDRPGADGVVLSLDEIRALRADVVIVDETCAAYLDPADSAVRLLSGMPGLVVVRSLSKGYCCGGLRVGFALSGRDVAARVRAVAAPLAVSALSFDFALALLGQGDVLAPLRERVLAVKPSFVDLLPEVRAGDPRLPWVTVPASVGPWLAERGLSGKRVPGGYRLSVPLSDARRLAVLG